MRRREFMAGLGGAVAWPLGAFGHEEVALRPDLLFGNSMFVELVLTGGIRYFEHQPRFGI
jgi:hypothetical protein